MQNKGMKRTGSRQLMLFYRCAGAGIFRFLFGHRRPAAGRGMMTARGATLHSYLGLRRGFLSGRLGSGLLMYRSLLLCMS